MGCIRRVYAFDYLRYFYYLAACLDPVECTESVCKDGTFAAYTAYRYLCVRAFVL